MWHSHLFSSHTMATPIIAPMHSARPVEDILLPVGTFLLDSDAQHAMSFPYLFNYVLLICIVCIAQLVHCDPRDRYNF
jgi:hypothetical protein